MVKWIDDSLTQISHETTPPSQNSPLNQVDLLLKHIQVGLHFNALL